MRFFSTSRHPYANLRGTKLQDAYLQSADLTNAELQGANLTNAKLQNANLTGAKLQDANLTGATLTEVKGLTQDQLDLAVIEDGGQPPDLSNAICAISGAPLVWNVKTSAA